MTKIALANLNAADVAGFMAALGDVYEHAPWVAQAASRQRPFATLAALHAVMMAAVRAAPPDQQRALINGHPDLAGKAARAGTMTVDSKAEQASAGLDRLSEAEFAQFHRLNNAYREKFGMPFIICVRRHSRDSILQQFERRLRNTMAADKLRKVPVAQFGKSPDFPSRTPHLGKRFKARPVSLQHHQNEPDARALRCILAG